MKKIFFILITLIFQHTYAQSSSNWLVKINDSIYTSTNFEKLYTKNWDLIKTDETLNPNDYLKLYILYHAKLQKAYELGFDKQPNFIDELQEQRKEVAEKYLINEDILNDLVNEAVTRSKEEVHAAHILFKVAPKASAEDTLKVYNKALAIRNKIQNKELSFDDAAKQYSEDPSASKNSGNLGFFSVFQMIYPFETAAYQTPVGEISMPIRSHFGYHLVYVKNRRYKEAPREVSQIFVAKNNAKTAKNNIEKAYNNLKKGTDFSEIAKATNAKKLDNEDNGYIGIFNNNKSLEEKFGKSVYALKEGDFTSILEDKNGYYIFKVNRILPEPTDEELQFQFLRKVKNDGRSRILNEQLSNYLSTEYNVKEDKDLLKSIAQEFNEKFFEDPEWANKKFGDNNQILLTFDKDQNITVSEFIQWLDENKSRFIRIEDIKSIVEIGFDVFKTQKLKSYFDAHLESRYPEFKDTMQDIKNGLLIFELLQKEIWQPAQKDIEAQKAFYQNNKEKWKENGTILPFDEVQKQVQSAYTDFYEEEYNNNLLKNINFEVNKEEMKRLTEKYSKK